MEISEALFDAVGILIDKKIQSIKFDETIEATVTDAKKASSGEYIVSTGAAKFTAYSYDTRYREKDVVLVTIPQGNYDNQKIIISKKVANQNDPIVYQTPFEKFINISNNLIKNTSTYKNGLGIWANYNDTKYSWPIDKEFNEVSLTPIWTGDYTKSPLQGYLMLGVQAQFASYLADYYTVQGNYGLTLQITFKEPSLNQTWNKYVFLDSDSFFGDPYNFETYYTQEEVFNISEYVNYPIVGLKLYLYQRNNFKDNEGNDIPTLNDEDYSSVSPNIYVKDPFVCVGIPIDTFQGDTAEIYCDNDLTYTKEWEKDQFYVYMLRNITTETYLSEGGRLYWSETRPYFVGDLSLYQGTSNDFHNNFIDGNHSGYFYKKVEELAEGENPSFTKSRATHNTKNIQLRWIHKDESSGIIKALSYDDIFSTDYEIRWYRYKLGAQSPDEFAGAHWERFYGVADEPDENQDWGKTQENDETTNELQIKFIPNVNYQTEQIKAIILKKESDNIYQRIAISNILTFTNDTQVSNPATILDMNALAIKYEDNERGHYFLYNEAGDIGKNEDSEIRKLVAVFDPSTNNVYDKAELIPEECTSITWTFPTSSTMITPMTGTKKDAVPSSDTVFSGVTEVGFTIKKHLNNGATNNTIQLDVLKDGVNYHAFVQPEFGTAGDNGSDYKVILTWRDGKNALNLSKNDNEKFLEPYNEEKTETALVGDIEIFDQAGDTVAWPQGATIDASWHVAEFSHETSEHRIKEKEEQDIYYPVFTSGDNALNFGLEHNPDTLYQPTGYYYFIETPSQTTHNYVKFNPETEEFTNDIDLETDQLYRKCGYILITNEEEYNTLETVYDAEGKIKEKTNWEENTYYKKEEKNKLEFRQIVTFASDPLNQETGEYNPNHGDGAEPIRLLQDNQNQYYKQYYYSKNKRYFIKINDQYVLDPWETYSEVETYYEPIEAKEKIYPNSLGDGGLKVEVDNDNHTVTIIADSNVNMDSLFILQLTLKNFGDYDLVSYYPIALKNGETETYSIQYIEGPDRVRYGSSGEADFYKNPYQITTYELRNGQFVLKRHGDNINSLDGYWKLLFPLRDSNNENNFKPVLQETGTKPGEGIYDKPVLNPVSIFIPDALPYGIQFVEIKTVDVVIGQEEVQDEEGVSHMEDILGSELEYVPIWTQPILVYENKYPSATLNKWNGKDIVTDNDTGTIVASGFAAGRKERDNTFTGVVLGDWSRTSTETAVTKNTGIYGFNHGAMSYAFKDDGTGFIGKDGRGRIHFNGNNANIYSSNWLGNSPEGMLLDIDDGYINMQSPDTNNPTYVEVTGSVKDRYFTWTYYRIKTGMTLYKQVDQSNQWAQVTNDTIIRINDLVSQDNLGSNSFQLIDGDGTSPNHILYWFDKIENTFPPNSIKELYKSNTGSNQVSAYDEYDGNSRYYIKENGVKYITLGANQPKTPLSIGTEKNVQSRRFRVDWDGTVHIQDGQFTGSISGSSINGSSVYANYLAAGNGKIGGWTITSNTLSSSDGTTTLDSSQGIKTNTITINLNGNKIGTIGLVESDIGGVDNINNSTGVGLQFYDTSVESILKITGSNAAIKFKNGTKTSYISCEYNAVSISGGSINLRGDVTFHNGIQIGSNPLSDYINNLIDAKITTALANNGAIKNELANYATTSALGDLQTLVNTYHPSSSNQGGS